MVVASLAMLATAPVAGNFWWQDAPRHALNGVFLRDFITAMPLHDARAWAVSYYLRYPSLTILFYPPLFYVVEAAMFALFGFSHFVAQASVTLFMPLGMVGAYKFSRLMLGRAASLAVALLVLGGPEAAFWGRQVMLDIPSGAALMAGMACFAQFLLRGRGRDCLFAVPLLLAAIYLKLNAVFVIPVLAVALIATFGPRVLLRPAVLAALAIGAVGMLPALWLTLHFGMTNMQSVEGRPGDMAADTLNAWLFYGRLLPRDVGWVAALLAIPGAVLLWRRAIVPRPIAVLLTTWFVIDYAFLSVIGVREPRHGLMLVFPLAFCAMLALREGIRRVPGIRTGWAVGGAAMGLGAATLLYSLFLYPPPVIDGYAKVADWVAAHAPPDAVVVFAGYRDGNFVFNMRTHPDRGDIATVRADKLLLRVAVERKRGVGQRDLDQAAILTLMKRLGVALVVVQPDFWDDLREMRRFYAVLHTSDFTPVARFPITGDVGIHNSAGHPDNLIEIYRPTYKVTPPRGVLDLAMPIIGEHFTGAVPSSR